jgi:spermidine synthase
MSVMRYALLSLVAAALVFLVAGVETKVEGGTAAIVRSCSPGLLLSALAFLAASWTWSRRDSLLRAIAAFESAKGGTGTAVLGGAGAGFALSAVVFLHLRVQSPEFLRYLALAAGVLAGVIPWSRAPWLAMAAVPAAALAIAFPSAGSATLAGIIVAGGGMELDRRAPLLKAAAGAAVGMGLAVLLVFGGVPAAAWPVVLAILFAPVLLRPFHRVLMIPSAAAVAAIVVHAVAGFAGVFLLVVAGGAWLAADWFRRLEPRLAAHGAEIDAIPEDRRGWWIALAACAGLVLELVLIRWQSSSFQLFAYFKNVTLFSAFLGLGMGYALGPARPLMAALVLPAMSLQVVLFHGLRFSGLAGELQNPIPEQIALGMGAEGSLARVAVTYGFLLLAFAATALTCVPLGQLAARLMRGGKPLRAYGWNLAGSLGGVLLFAALAQVWSPPAAWFLVAGLLLAPFFAISRDAKLGAPSFVCLGAALLVLLAPRDPGELEVHSPYQVLVLKHRPEEPPILSVSNVYFQNVLDLRPESVERSEKLRRAAAHYELPYRLRSRPGTVLVVGSGTGNDVAAALRSGAPRVDAVEIDPAILGFGGLHPERPYENPRVRAFVEDARQHLRRTTERYELIVYGLLDSHTLLSGRSNVRLDSFVYTVEGLRDARARLAPDGVVALAFCVATDEIARKLYLMLREAFDGAEPRVFRTAYDEGMVFAIGPGLRPDASPPAGVEDVTARVRGLTVAADVSTDDWPFLYMGRRQYPKSYLVMAIGVLALSALLVRRVLPGARILGAPVFFFLGAGFMLIEAKAITQLALVFGSTWQVTSAVIAAVLVMAFAGNWIVSRWGRVPTGPAYVLLGLSIAAGMAVPVGAFTGLPPLASQALAAGLVTLPVLFSGFIFSGALKNSSDLPGALASNLVGAMAGGLIEYNSMYFGFNALGFAALALYAAAWIASRRIPVCAVNEPA